MCVSLCFPVFLWHDKSHWLIGCSSDLPNVWMNWMAISREFPESDNPQAHTSQGPQHQWLLVQVDDNAQHGIPLHGCHTAHPFQKKHGVMEWNLWANLWHTHTYIYNIFDWISTYYATSQTKQMRITQPILINPGKLFQSLWIRWPLKGESMGIPISCVLDCYAFRAF